MNYFQEYEKLKETQQLITIGSIWDDGVGPIEVIGFDDPIVIFKDISGLGIFSGEYFDWHLKKFMRNFKRVE